MNDIMAPNWTHAERIAMALESIAKDVKRFVDAAEKNEVEASEEQAAVQRLLDSYDEE